MSLSISNMSTKIIVTRRTIKHAFRCVQAVYRACRVMSTSDTATRVPQLITVKKNFLVPNHALIQIFGHSREKLKYTTQHVRLVTECILFIETKWKPHACIYEHVSSQLKSSERERRNIIENYRSLLSNDWVKFVIFDPILHKSKSPHYQLKYFLYGNE